MQRTEAGADIRVPFEVSAGMAVVKIGEAHGNE